MHCWLFVVDEFFFCCGSDSISLVVVERERPIGAAYESTNQFQDNKLTKTANRTEVSADVTGAESGEKR